MARTIALMAIVGAALWCFWITAQIAWIAFRTGRLIRRGGYASRRDRPMLFWGGLAFWMLLTALVVHTAGMLVWISMGQ